MNDRRVSRGLLFAVMLCFFAVPSLAQTPTWSRGIQSLPISHDECSNRARRALEAEGYTVENQGGSFSGDYYFGGYKNIHNAVITCNVSHDSKTWVNVFVASSVGNRDGNVPGAERMKLQQRMDQSASRGCGLGTRWRGMDGGWSGVLTRRGNSNLFDGVWTRDGQQFTAVLTVSIDGNRVNVSRRNSTSGGDCELNGTLGDDGVTVTGTNVCTHGTGHIQLTIECQR